MSYTWAGFTRVILDVVFHGIGTDTGVRPACRQRSATSRDVSWYTCSVSVLFLRENMTEYVFRGGARGRAVSVNLNHHGRCFFEGVSSRGVVGTAYEAETHLQALMFFCMLEVLLVFIILMVVYFFASLVGFRNI